MNNVGLKFKLVALGLAVVLMGALVVLATWNSQRQSTELEKHQKQIHLESFKLAHDFNVMLREVADQMLRYRTARNATAWGGFLKVSSELDGWIDEEKVKLSTPLEQAVLQKIDDAYDSYLILARDIHIKVQTANLQDSELAELTELIARRRRRLSDMGQDLAKAHIESRTPLLTQAEQSLAQFRWLALGSLGLLFVFGTALSIVVYHDMIAPLRVKLVETYAVVQQHEKLASLGMLAAGVAHEIRNPLTAIKTALFILQKKLRAGSPERADAELVEREILRLERIVNDFLLFARPSEPELTRIPADQPLQEIQRLLTPQLAQANIQLVLEKSAPLHINVDPTQIKQVLINLVKNAAEAIGQNGTIKLGVRHTRKRLSNSEIDVVILGVTDTGKGILPEVEKRLFDPFFTTKESGTGLGLSIAARIVQKQGGALEYQTQVNSGTTFGIVLPQAT